MGHRTCAVYTEQLAFLCLMCAMHLLLYLKPCRCSLNICRSVNTEQYKFAIHVYLFKYRLYLSLWVVNVLCFQVLKIITFWDQTLSVARVSASYSLSFILTFHTECPLLKLEILLTPDLLQTYFSRTIYATFLEKLQSLLLTFDNIHFTFFQW